MRTKIALAAVMTLALVAVPALAGPTTFDISGSALADVDELTPSTTNIVTALSGTISDLNLVLQIDISSAGANPGVGGIVAADNLDIFLTHGATTVQVYASTGDMAGDGFDALIDATFDDDAAGAYGAGDVTGTVQPSPDALSAFSGMDLSGTWTLSMVDGFGIDGDGTDLVAWSINGAFQAVPEPGTIALFGLGALGLVACRVRRRKKAAPAEAD